MKQLSLPFALLFSAIAAWLCWVGFNRPVPISWQWNEPVESVSFAPFRRGQSPLNKIYPTSQQIQEDLQSLVGLSNGLRTYSTRFGMEDVPEMAARAGLKVTFGAWLGDVIKEKSRRNNEEEINGLIKAANDYPDVITRVIVGNEVLLRNDLKPSELISYIRKVKSSIKQPVSYADVWAFYLKYPEVVQELDYLTIHILPFWEDEPVRIDDAGEHILKIVRRIREAFPGKPIFIGETGWPSIGRNRGGARVNIVTEASYIRMMANLAEREHFDYNIVEGFDQPWKSALENTVGAAWGLLDSDRKAKFSMTGDVYEINDWKERAILSVLLGLAAGLLWGRCGGGFGSCLTIGIFGQIMAWLIVTTFYHSEAVTFRGWQYFWLPLRLVPPVILAFGIMQRASDILFSPSGRTRIYQFAAIIFVLEAVYSIAWSALLFMDGRYRDIPIIDFCLPVLGMVMLAILQRDISFNQLFGAENIPLWMRRALPRLALALPLAAFFSLASESLALAMGSDFRADHPDFWSQSGLIVQGLFSNREMVIWAIMQLVWGVAFFKCRNNSFEKVVV